MADPDFDVVVVGGGPAGATAAAKLAQAGRSVLMLDKAGRIIPCGGAIPPSLVKDFEIPDEPLCAHITSARMISPTDRKVDMPIENGYVGMVDREKFDDYLRHRAADAGATWRNGVFVQLDHADTGEPVVTYKDADGPVSVRCKVVIGADGARSLVARQGLDGAITKSVFAYHEIIKTPEVVDPEAYDGERCEVYYQGKLSPDFYACVFPHGKTASIGVGSAHKGFSLRSAVRELREATGLNDAQTVRTEGAPIPLKPLKGWDNGRDVVVVGDAAGVVAPCSGEGIYYAMASGQIAAEQVDEVLATGKGAALAKVRKRFMKDHGRVFMALGVLQWFWYANDKRRERFVTMCADKDVQQLTFEAYMNKELVRRKKVAHLRVMLKDIAHLLRLVRPAPPSESRTAN